MQRLLLLAGLLHAASLFAQLPTYGWARSLGTVNNLDHVKAGADGRVHVFGTFNGNHDLDLGPGQLIVSESGSSYGAFVATAEADGTLAWAIALSSTTNVNTTSLHVNPDGSLIAHGNFRGILDADPAPGGELQFNAGSSFDQFVGHYDADGNLIRAVSWGNSGDLNYGVMAVAPDGSLYIMLSPSGTLDVDPGPNAVSYGPNPSGERILVKLGPDWSFQWVRRIGLVNPITVHAPSTGGIIVVGTFGGTQLIGTAPNTITLTGNPSLTDGFVLRLDDQGLPVEGVSYGGTGTELVDGSALAPDGSIIILGEYTGTTDLDPGTGELSFTAAAGYDAYAMKIDAGLELVWGQTWDAGVTALALDGYGDAYIIGALSGPVDLDPGPGTSIVQSSFTNAYHLKLDGADGSFMHAFPASDGATGYITARSLALSENGAILTTGAFRASTDMNPLGGDDVLTVQVVQTEEFYVRRLDQAIGLGMRTEDPEALLLFPVPCEQTLHVLSQSSPAAPYSIRDAQGRVLLSGRLAPGTPRTIGVEALAPGAYLLEIGGQVGRFIKQ